MALLGAICFIGGLLLGGSDGALFPWLNLVGVAMFFAAGMIARREGWPE